MRDFIAANWKMNKTLAEAGDFFDAFIPVVKGVSDRDIVVAPPFTALAKAAEKVKGSNVLLAAQDVFWEEKGAYTGEISALMLTDLGCDCVIIGHSERRQYFSEDDVFVNRKIRASKKAGLLTIFCVGESLAERESGKTFEVIEREVRRGLVDIDPAKLVIAYEPIWAIGTGKTATVEQAQEIHAFVRRILGELYGAEADEMRILYGGSVTPDNIDSLMACRDVNGALVGGASLKPESFSRIVCFNKENA